MVDGRIVGDDKMIQLIGIQHNVEVEIREKLSITPRKCERVTKHLLDLCEEVVVLSTCNRTEVYLNADAHDEQFIQEVFEYLGWDYTYRRYTFYLSEQEAINHLFEVVCGFDSMLLGEDQILGQIKNAYELSLDLQAVSGKMLRLFQNVITCGKDFRCQTNLCNIPVSLASMVVREARKKNKKRFMLLGFGDIGQLVAKYILCDDFDALYIAVRNVDVVDIQHEKVEAVSFHDKTEYFDQVDCMISCTSAPHLVIKKEDVPDLIGHELLIFDMAVPRDVSEEVRHIEQIQLYDTDQIGHLQDEHYQKRKEVMYENKSIIDEYIREFEEWCKLKEITPHIQQIKNSGQTVYEQRYRTFQNKKDAKDNEILAEMLLKSATNVFVNKAIKVLKEEHLEGRGEECLRILAKIF